MLEKALNGMSKHREALRNGGASNPSYISEHTYLLAQYIALAEDELSELESSIIRKEAESFNKHVLNGKSPNAAKESLKREFIEERSQIIKISRLVSGGWKLVSENQSRVKHLIAEANNQI